MIQFFERIELNAVSYKTPSWSRKDIIFQTRHTELKTPRTIISLKSAVQNSTEPQKPEESLLKDTRFFDFLIDNLTGISYVLDTNGCFLDWNKNLETVLGYSSNELQEINAI